jgi:hypothetical protein
VGHGEIAAKSFRPISGLWLAACCLWLFHFEHDFAEVLAFRQQPKAVRGLL